MSSSAKMWRPGPFNEDHWKKKVVPMIPLLVSQLNPEQIVVYLPTLTTNDREEVICRQHNSGKRYAAQVLLANLEKRPRGFNDLMKALMHPEVGLIETALRIDSRYAESIARETGIDIYDYIEQDSDEEPFRVMTATTTPENAASNTGQTVNNYFQIGSNNTMNVGSDEEIEGTLTEDSVSCGDSTVYTITEDESVTTVDGQGQAEQKYAPDSTQNADSVQQSLTCHSHADGDGMQEDFNIYSENVDEQSELNVLQNSSKGTGAQYEAFSQAAMTQNDRFNDQYDYSDDTEPKLAKTAYPKQVEDIGFVGVDNNLQDKLNTTLYDAKANSRNIVIHKPHSVNLGSLPQTPNLTGASTDLKMLEGQNKADINESKITTTLLRDENSIESMATNETDETRRPKKNSSEIDENMESSNTNMDSESTFFIATEGDTETFILNGFSIHPNGKMQNEATSACPNVNDDTSPKTDEGKECKEYHKFTKHNETDTCEYPTISDSVENSALSEKCSVKETPNDLSMDNSNLNADIALDQDGLVEKSHTSCVMPQITVTEPVNDPALISKDDEYTDELYEKPLQQEGHKMNPFESSQVEKCTSNVNKATPDNGDQQENKGIGGDESNLQYTCIKYMVVSGAIILVSYSIWRFLRKAK